MKHCIISWLVLALSLAHAVEPLPLELRQVVIRAPEMDVITWAADPAVTDAQLAEHLWQAVREGRARVVSDVAGAVEDTRTAVVSTGHHVWLPSEVDQDFDRLFMTPTAYQEYPVGTSVTCKPEVVAEPGKPTPTLRIRADWSSRFSPREPLVVQWPSSWLNIYEDEKITDKLLHGWLDWHDLFEESAMGRISFHPGTPTLIAILPPADQVWPGTDGDKGRLLDVFMGQIGRPVVEASAPLSPRTLLLGIALPSRAALELLAERKPGNDGALLTNLLAKVRAGAARMIFTAGSANDPLAGNRTTLTSARSHAYPTEMPSIPSAWDERPVGTSWESDANLVALRQDLAPPARTEWRLAQDVPAAIMWEPRFRFLDIRATHGFGSGTYLLSLLHIPEVMRGPGLDADQTVFVFAKHQTLPRKPPAGLISKDPFAPGGDTFDPPVEYEAEMIVFEVPAKEEAEWQPAATGAKESDPTRLQSLLGRVHAGTATLAAHLLVRRPQGYRSSCRIVEEYQTATEFDPPRRPSSPRMRPTALETLPVGSRWDMDLSDPLPDDGVVSLDHTFEHSTAIPVEPPLAETLAIALGGGDEDYPGAVHHRETWKGSITVPLDQPLCLGTQNPPGDDREVRHVAFLRVRKLPAPTP